jgi:hypothetical protein
MPAGEVFFKKEKFCPEAEKFYNFHSCLLAGEENSF